MSDDLLKRLRGWARDIYEGSTATWAMDQDLKSAADRIEKLEANLSNAVDALRYYAQDDDDGGWLAKYTLAEITGGNDE